MIVMMFLETLAAGVGLFNLGKGVYSIYEDAINYKKMKTEYNEYIELQKRPIKKLTESQYAIYEGEFMII